jgi:hypothetical protein
MTNCFFESNENLVGASKENPYFCITDAFGITGIGPDENATCITDKNYDIILEANNENLIWLGGCIHRFRSPLGYGPISARRALDLQKYVHQRVRDCPEVITVNERSIFLGHAFGWHAYGHLHDTLQRLYFCAEEARSDRPKIVVNRHDRIIDFLGHLSATLGKIVTQEDLIILDNKHSYNFRELIYSHSPATLTNYTEDSLRHLNTSYRNFFECTDSKIAGVYLSRNHVRPGSRGVINETEVVDYLNRKGYVILFGNEPLNKIVRIFSSSLKVIGAHGSLLANTFLCRPDAEILELCPHNRVDVTQKNKLKYARKYEQILVQADSAYNLEIDMDLLRSFSEGS